MNPATLRLDESRSVQLKRRSGLKKLCGLILVGASTIASPPDAAIVQGNVDNRDTKARRVVEQFMKALVAKDIASMMKAVAVPFFLEGRKNIKTFEELRKEFAKTFERGDPTTIKYVVGKVQAFSTVQKRGSAKVRELLEQVLDEDDRWVEVTMSMQSKQDRMSVLVSFRGGKVRVVGFRF